MGTRIFLFHHQKFFDDIIVVDNICGSFGTLNRICKVISISWKAELWVFTKKLYWIPEEVVGWFIGSLSISYLDFLIELSFFWMSIQLVSGLTLLPLVDDFIVKKKKKQTKSDYSNVYLFTPFNVRFLLGCLPLQFFFPPRFLRHFPTFSFSYRVHCAICYFLAAIPSSK